MRKPMHFQNYVGHLESVITYFKISYITRTVYKINLKIKYIMVVVSTGGNWGIASKITFKKQNLY